jgi:hypothetical protein
MEGRGAPMRPKHRGAVLTLFATMVVIATAAHAQQNTRNFYNSRGAFAGTARTHGNATTFTDKRARFVGSAINRGNGTALHDKHGHFTRSMLRPQR